MCTEHGWNLQELLSKQWLTAGWCSFGICWTLEYSTTVRTDQERGLIVGTESEAGYSHFLVPPPCRQSLLPRQTLRQQNEPGKYIYHLKVSLSMCVCTFVYGLTSLSVLHIQGWHFTSDLADSLRWFVDLHFFRTIPGECSIFQKTVHGIWLTVTTCCVMTWTHIYFWDTLKQCNKFHIF